LQKEKDYVNAYIIELFAGIYPHPEDKEYPTIILFKK
jgi:hypothetical protein